MPPRGVVSLGNRKFPLIEAEVKTRRGMHVYIYIRRLKGGGAPRTAYKSANTCKQLVAKKKKKQERREKRKIENFFPSFSSLMLPNAHYVI